MLTRKEALAMAEQVAFLSSNLKCAVERLGKIQALLGDECPHDLQDVILERAVKRELRIYCSCCGKIWTATRIGNETNRDAIVRILKTDGVE